jgi:hypothetical protein
MSFHHNGDAIAQGNIVFASFEWFHYCNSVYNSSGNGSMVDSSTGPTAYDNLSTNVLSGLVEGPYKFLFNCVAFGLHCRTSALRKSDKRSILYNYVGEWNSSWTMYSDAILDEEKIQYFVNISSDTNQVKFGRDLIQPYDSIEAYYKAKLSDSMPDYHKQKVSKMDTSTIDFYIEVTNPEVLISNSTAVSSPQDESIPSSYSVKKMTSRLLKPYAYTDKYSPKISIPSSFGPYVVKDVPGISSSDSKKINSEINPITQFQSYPFSLQTEYSYISATDKPVSFNGTVRTNMKFPYRGVAKEKVLRQRWGSVTKKWSTKDPDIPSKPYVKKDGYTVLGETKTDLPCSNVKSSIDSNLYAVVDSDRPYNNFIYTRDIDRGNSTNTWSTAYSGNSYNYVKYIQIALKSFGRYGGGNFKNWPVDGKYGPKTRDAIQSFQQTQKDLGNCIYVDGTVDSETKSLLARRLKTLKDEDPAAFAAWRSHATDYGVAKFWDAAVGAVENLTIGREYKKITFTGFDGPSRITDVIYFSIPEGYDEIKTLTIDFGVWKNAKVYSYGYSDTDHTIIDYGSGFVFNTQLTTRQRLDRYHTSVINKKADSDGIVNINLNVRSANCRHMFIRVQSSEKLKTLDNKYGEYAEGYSIQAVKVSAKRADTVVAPVIDWTLPVTGATYNWTNVYEAVDSLVSAPDAIEEAYLDGKPIRRYASGQLEYDYDQQKLKSNTIDKRVYVRGTEDGYYKWNGSSWTKEVISDSTTDIQIEDYVVELSNTVDIVAYATVTQNFSNLSAEQDLSYTYDTKACRELSQPQSSSNIYFTSLSYRYKDREYTQSLPPSTYNLNNVSFTTNAGVSFFFSNPSGEPEIINNSSSTITSLYDDTKKAITSPNSVVNIEYGDEKVSGGYGKITLSTSSTYYSGSKIVKTGKKRISNNEYVLVGIDGKVLDNRNEVTVHDGILLLSKKPSTYNSGQVYLNNLQTTFKPIGIPGYTEISAAILSIPDGVERDIRFGDVNVYSEITNTDGMIYGFYDIKEKEFIGKKISYVDLLSKGLDNVYLAVCAIDADGNTQNQIDYIGPKISTTFKPVSIPLKKIYPVYSVKFNSNSRIRLGNMSLDIEKNKAWPLSVTQGSFRKSVYLNSNIYSDWKANYLNQELICQYETQNTPGVSWSKIFGKGYYQIKDENPIIVSPTSIKVRQTPFLVWAEPTNYDYSVLKLVRPQFQAYKNTNLLATKSSEKVWETIPLSKVKNYNAETGVIEFTERLLPVKEEDIKISYVSKNSDIQIYQVDGQEIPLNPLLNKDTIRVDQPLYVYLLPTKIEKRSNITANFSGYSKVTEYTNSYPINFTYDKDIFNSTSNKYDPFALLIGIVFYSRSQIPVNVFDTRLRGGGVSYEYDTKEAVSYNKNAISYWDMYPSQGMAYPKGGYVVVKLPKEIKDNFLNITEIYDIVYRNLTAGIAFEVQDMDGNSFGVK